MPITYGRTLTRFWGAEQLSGTVLMKAYTTHTQKSEVFLSYQRADHDTALNLARYLDEVGRSVFIDIHDDTLKLGDSALDSALMTAILNSNTMVIVVSGPDPEFVVGALGDRCIDSFGETKGDVQAVGKQTSSRVFGEITSTAGLWVHEPMGS